MCRLMYLPAGPRLKFKKLLGALHSLEKSFGGDGNGLATTAGTFLKGVTLPLFRIAQLLSNDPNHHAIFHTRKTSMGPTTDSLCHPFLTRRGGFLAHNGHWGEASITQSILSGAWSDTRIAAKYISIYGWERFTGVCDSGVWMYLKGRGLYTHYATGSLHVHESGILASEPCLPGGWYPAAYGTYKPGEWIPEQKKWPVSNPPAYSGFVPTTHWFPGRD